jgi:prepilin-type N-terminal cleavage/methylation domain-containing protein
MKIPSRTAGFTMIEIMIVIGIISILAATVLFSISGAKDSSRISKAKTDLEDIKMALQLYVETTGIMPPGPPATELCTLCGWRNNNVTLQSRWESVVVPQVASTTPVTMPVLDPWGRFYAYDNNFGVFLADNPSIVCSVGPDGILQTWTTPQLAIDQRTSQGDDICVFLREIDDVGL